MTETTPFGGFDLELSEKQENKHIKKIIQMRIHEDDDPFMQLLDLSDEQKDLLIKEIEEREKP